MTNTIPAFEHATVTHADSETAESAFIGAPVIPLPAWKHADYSYDVDGRPEDGTAFITESVCLADAVRHNGE